MKKIIFTLLTVCLILPGIISADGGIMPPDNYVMWETDQTGVIFYESDTQTETLVISMAYEGNASDFAWLIPVPNQPEVSQGSQELFTTLKEMTSTNTVSFEATGGLGFDGAASKEESVTVVEQKTVDYYEVSVLASDDSQALSKWLNENGYNYPEEYTYIFNEYINNDWYFVAAKIIPELAGNENIISELSTGTATPLQLTFTAKNLVYPLKISQAVVDYNIVSSVATSPEAIFDYNDSYAAPDYMSVTLYVITDHKQDISSMAVQYADEIKADKIETLALDTNGDAWVEPENNTYYLTKFYKYMAVADMDVDLFPKQADDDKKITSEYEWDSENTTDLILFSLLFSGIGLIVIVISPWVLLFVIFSIIFYAVKNKKAKIAMVILQILDSFSTFCFMGVGGVAIALSIIDIQKTLEYSAYLEDEMFALAASIAATLVFALLTIAKIIALVIQKKKYKKLK